MIINEYRKIASISYRRSLVLLIIYFTAIIGLFKMVGRYSESGCQVDRWICEGKMGISEMFAVIVSLSLVYNLRALIVSIISINNGVYIEKGILWFPTLSGYKSKKMANISKVYVKKMFSGRYIVVESNEKILIPANALIIDQDSINSL